MKTIPEPPLNILIGYKNSFDRFIDSLGFSKVFKFFIAEDSFKRNQLRVSFNNLEYVKKFYQNFFDFLTIYQFTDILLDLKYISKERASLMALSYGDDYNYFDSHYLPYDRNNKPYIFLVPDNLSDFALIYEHDFKKKIDDNMFFDGIRIRNEFFLYFFDEKKNIVIPRIKVYLEKETKEIIEKIIYQSTGFDNFSKSVKPKEYYSNCLKYLNRNETENINKINKFIENFRILVNSYKNKNINTKLNINLSSNFIYPMPGATDRVISLKISFTRKEKDIQNFFDGIILSTSIEYLLIFV